MLRNALRERWQTSGEVLTGGLGASAASYVGLGNPLKSTFLPTWTRCKQLLTSTFDAQTSDPLRQIQWALLCYPIPGRM